MKNLLTATLLLFFSATVFGSAKDDAMTAYFLMEESPFDRDVFSRSMKLINSAYQADQNEPWVYIASSLSTMQRGYKIGSWFHSKSFKPGTIDKAHEFALKAVEHGADKSQAHAHLARVMIIKQQYREAWNSLNTAYQRDNNNFYAWFYKGIIGYYMKDYDRALSHFDKAQTLTTKRYHQKLVTRQKQRVARGQGNKLLEEQLYIKNINDYPDNAYMYGNYAHYLLKNNRPSESVTYYKKAISIKPYRQALKMLIVAEEKAAAR
ncbi:tetratricopeptide repeat protein [Motiliproteus coralliicola]|nr:hypothetical protein [Motiliproteus coralliicola]